MKFYGLSGLSGRLDTLDTAFRGRIKKIYELSGLSGRLDFLDTPFRDRISKIFKGKIENVIDLGIL